jgi:rhamnose transport system ATP-binding protein
MDPTAPVETPILSLQGIKKHFGGIQALSGVDLHLYPGQVMGLLGENGAGKSTAVKILTGIYIPDGGQILSGGKPVEFRGTQDAWKQGITAVHQETVMFDELSVAENIFSGHFLKRGRGLLDWAAMRAQAARLMHDLQSDIRPETLLKTLSVAQKHIVEIARALSHDSSVVIMDEPTAALSAHEIEELYAIVRHLKTLGKAILFISHKFDDIFAICDRYTVYRDGGYVGEGLIKDVTQDDLVRMMVGRSVSRMFPKPVVAIGEPVLEVRGLGNDTEFDDISFTLRKREVLGFYGLVGSGRTELMEALFGLGVIRRGDIRLKGRPLVPGSPRNVIDHGIVYVPEDRQRNGVILPLSIQQNITLPSVRKLAHGLFLNDRAEGVMTDAIVARLAVKCADTDQKAGELSGGNQQKVVIGKWLATQPEIVILDEPTKGIDIGSKAAVHSFIGELVTQGLSVVMVSSELPELMGMADRIVIMHKGRIAGILDRPAFDAEAIVSAASGLAEPATAVGA